MYLVGAKGRTIPLVLFFWRVVVVLFVPYQLLLLRPLLLAAKELEGTRGVVVLPSCLCFTSRVQASHLQRAALLLFSH